MTPVINISGLDELERQLITVGKEVATKILRDAGREALVVVREDMKQHAGFDETYSGEHMRDAISITSTTKTKGNTVVTLRVDPARSITSKRWRRSLALSNRWPSLLFVRRWITTK